MHGGIPILLRPGSGGQKSYWPKPVIQVFAREVPFDGLVALRAWSARLSLRFDVLVHAEQVGRVVSGLERGKPNIRLPVGILDERLAVLSVAAKLR
jgi:hypothetical protein